MANTLLAFGYPISYSSLYRFYETICLYSIKYHQIFRLSIKFTEKFITLYLQAAIELV